MYNIYIYIYIYIHIYIYIYTYIMLITTMELQMLPVKTRGNPAALPKKNGNKTIIFWFTT